MADLMRVNPENIIGGPGRLVIKPYDGTFPAVPSDVMDLGTYDLLTGFRDVGATTDGITLGRAFDTEDFEVDQMLAPADTDITSWTHSLTTTLAENTNANKAFAMVGGQTVTVAPTLGAATTLAAAATSGSQYITVAAAGADFVVGRFVRLSGGGNTEDHKIASISGTTIYLETMLKNAYPGPDGAGAGAASVTPITQNGYSTVTFGTPQALPDWTAVVISKKKNGKLQMAVIYKCKITGDDKEQVYGRGKRTLPLSLAAYPVEGRPENDNVYYEYSED